MKVDGREVELTNQDKVLFTDTGITKGELVEYYRRIADYMLPLIKDRPLVLKRYPDGIDTQGFFQKEAGDYFPDWITTQTVKLKKGGRQHLVVADSAATLVYLANQAVITPHAWLSTIKHLNKADRMVIDLDPSTDDFEPVKAGARALRKIFENHGHKPLLMTTGSRGLHVIAHLDKPQGFDEVRDEASEMADELSEAEPERFTTAQSKDKRGDRLFLDVARNAYGQTAVAPYAVRARPGAPVATPLDWDELDTSDLSPQKYTTKNIFQRLSRIKNPWR